MAQLHEQIGRDAVDTPRSITKRLVYLGDYVMVHAGVPPEGPSPDDLMWIRDDFLRPDAGHGKVVVHGHSHRLKPEVRENRIGIDTTAFATNVLSCLVLEGSSQRFLGTG